MRKFAWLYVVVGAAAACGSGSSGSTELVCGEGTSGTLTAGGRVEVAAGVSQDLAGAAVAATDTTTLPGEPVTIACAAADIVPAGYIALGPAVQIGPERFPSDRPFSITLPYKAARLPDGGGRRHVRVVAKHTSGAGAEPFFTPVTNLSLDDADAYASRATFNAAQLTTYQIVAPADAGAAKTRHFTYRGIAGVSMGGGAATAIGLRNSDRFDLIGDLGGEPGPDVIYTMSMISEFHFGGFCTAEDEMNGVGNVGELCPSRQRPAFADQFEIKADFEHLPYQEGGGVGLTLRRNLYLRGSRDLSRALGNPGHYNMDNSYLPPGVPVSWLSDPNRCDNPITLTNFFDREFNPDGTWPVITFCDGGDSTAMGLGVFDPSLPQTNVVEVLLAVDLNGNGRRDFGEPLVANAYEPWNDSGIDGMLDQDEPGYDAVTNPDPNGDDWHYWRNPRGTEKNFRFDQGEPFEDLGLDGVAGTAQQPAGFDFGEGDGEWTLNPNVDRWYANDAAQNLTAMGATGRDRIYVWADAGIRDFFNGHVSANGLLGSMSTLDMPVAAFDGFAPLTHATAEGLYDFNAVDWTEWPANISLRYGDPDATEAAILDGDGRHVGTGRQIINRITTMFAWFNARWPGGDRAIAPQSQDNFLLDQVFTSPSSGRETPYAIFVPPGYYENPTLTYPVVYFLHGYGQEPNDLVALSAIFSNYMIDEDREEAKRFQKMIIVYVDGRCRPGGDIPLPQEGDGCEQGNFYMDSPSNATAQMETAMFELMDEIDSLYRTKQAEDVEVVP